MPTGKWSAAHRSNGTPAVADPKSGRKPDADLEAGIDQAWGVLEQVAKWVVHAEGKASLILASVGVIGGVLFSVVNGRQLDLATACFAWLSAALILASGLCAAVSLWPRVGRSREPVSLLYFGEIARRYPDSPAPYAEALTRCSASLTGWPSRSRPRSGRTRLSRRGSSAGPTSASAF